MELVWNPVYTALEAQTRAGDELLLIIVPFAKLEALHRLRSVARRQVKWRIICRWKPEDLVSGASDISIYEYLKDEGCDLYTNPSIHLKLYVFESNQAFTTSGNLTLRGLGYGEPANVETGTMLQLQSSDWIRIYEILDASRRVDDKMYKSLYDYVQSCPPPVSPPPPPAIWPVNAKQFTIGSLPAIQTPTRLGKYYFGMEHASFSSEEVRRAAHDLYEFYMPRGLDETQFEARLGETFRTVPFVVEFVALLKLHGSLRFGAVNNWIHDKCEDIPLPYKWEIKENTRIFYEWLGHFFPEITWNIPGAHSQVIYWNQAAATASDLR